MVTITLSGGKELQAALQNMQGQLASEVSKAVTGTALELRGDVIKRINRGPASGRVYQKYNPRRTHQASAPGQAPASDTGRLANSIFFDTRGPLTAVVGSNVVYALYLEYGTTRMAARPFFRPAVEAIRPKLQSRLEAAVRKATQ
jgi:HK97 gp10 family phage protein